MGGWHDTPFGRVGMVIGQVIPQGQPHSFLVRKAIISPFFPNIALFIENQSVSRLTSNAIQFLYLCISLVFPETHRSKSSLVPETIFVNWPSNRANEDASEQGTHGNLLT